MFIVINVYFACFCCHFCSYLAVSRCLRSMPQWPIHANVGGGEATEAGPVGGSVAEAVLATVTGAGPAGGRGLEAGSVGVAEEKLDRAKQYEGGRGVLSLQQQLYQEEQARVTRGAYVTTNS